MFGFSLLISKTSAICGNKSPFKGTESECKGGGAKSLMSIVNLLYFVVRPNQSSRPISIRTPSLLSLTS